MDLRPVWGGNRNLTVAALLLACPLLWSCRCVSPPPSGPAVPQDHHTAVYESQLRGETPKYWACPEELLPRYADGVLEGRPDVPPLNPAR